MWGEPIGGWGAEPRLALSDLPVLRTRVTSHDARSADGLPGLSTTADSLPARLQRSPLVDWCAQGNVTGQSVNGQEEGANQIRILGGGIGHPTRAWRFWESAGVPAASAVRHVTLVRRLAGQEPRAGRIEGEDGEGGAAAATRRTNQAGHTGEGVCPGNLQEMWMWTKRS
jgi:hypothetical protein